jgi:hypothetical protein
VHRLAVASGLTGPTRQVPDRCMAVKTITIDLEAYEVGCRKLGS